MYLNIINNIKHESKRKSKKEDHFLDKEKDKTDNGSEKIVNYNDNFIYYSVFYGDLTKNWIKIRH